MDVNGWRYMFIQLVVHNVDTFGDNQKLGMNFRPSLIHIQVILQMHGHMHNVSILCGAQYLQISWWTKISNLIYTREAHTYHRTTRLQA